MARPKGSKNRAAPKARKPYQLRLSDEERAVFTAIASRQGTSMGAWVRAVARAAAGLDSPMKSVVPEQST